jgi:NAD(P)H-dependent FMN reductase
MEKPLTNFLVIPKNIKVITIISGTNRPGNEASSFAQHYFNVCSEFAEQPVKLIDLVQLGHEWFHAYMYEESGIADNITEIQQNYLIPSEKIIYVVPEYNGSFPGVLKLFLDACSIKNYKETFGGKKAALVGIATGRAGNLRGLEHLTGILNHLGTIVYPDKLPISSIKNVLDDHGNIAHGQTLKTIENHIHGFLQF